MNRPDAGRSVGQLPLFAAAPAPVRHSGMPPCVERAWERAYSDQVTAEVLAVAAARPEEWLGWNDFRSLIRQHDIGCCFGHAIGAIARRGLLQERKVCLGKGIGAAQPGSGNYQGYTCQWKACA
jgi:hypothetical protein